MAVDGDQLHLRHLEWVGEKKSVRVSECVRMRGTKKRKKCFLSYLSLQQLSPKNLKRRTSKHFKGGSEGSKKPDANATRAALIKCCAVPKKEG